MSTVHVIPTSAASVLQNIEDATAVDFNFDRREVCWIDLYQEEIRCSSLAGHSRHRPVSSLMAGAGTGHRLGSTFLGEGLDFPEGGVGLFTVSDYWLYHASLL